MIHPVSLFSHGQYRPDWARKCSPNLPSRPFVRLRPSQTPNRSHGYGLGCQTLQSSALNGTICLYIKGFGVASRTVILIDMHGVTGSSPVPPTIPKLLWGKCLHNPSQALPAPQGQTYPCINPVWRRAEPRPETSASHGLAPSAWVFPLICMATTALCGVGSLLLKGPLHADQIWSACTMDLSSPCRSVRPLFPNGGPVRL